MYLAARKSARCAIRTFHTSKCLSLLSPIDNRRYIHTRTHDSAPRSFRRIQLASSGQVVFSDRQEAGPSSAKRYLSQVAVEKRKRNDRLKERDDAPSDPESTKEQSRRRGASQTTHYGAFEKLVEEHLSALQDHFLNDKARFLTKQWGLTPYQFQSCIYDAADKVRHSCKLATTKSVTNQEANPTFHKLKTAFVDHSLEGLKKELRFIMESRLGSLQFADEELKNQQRIADFRYPLEWYPATRAIQRKIHLHVGPTNSGKTYHALKRLEQAKTGIYAGPLRLLAHEVYTRFNDKGKPCALVTGEERRVPEGMKTVMSSCTVEMVPLNVRVEVCVIDEIQMIGDSDRGWAWTSALLGVQADEVHLCGELRTVPLIKKLCAAMGDELIVHEYNRLGPLEVSSKSLGGKLTDLRKGDAIILFSRKAIHAMKNEVEKFTGKRCAVVYGSLPPETRAQQAALFNDPDNDYDYLVASNAVGMGLNLSIKRIIFESTSKFNGTKMELIEASDVKQIAGRAGRYKTAAQAVKDGPIDIEDGMSSDPTPPPVGYVTTLTKWDLPMLTHAMNADVQPLTTAGIDCPNSVVMRFAQYFPSTTPFSYILLRLREIASMNPLFHLCVLKEHLIVADAIQDCKLSVPDRLILIQVPISMGDRKALLVLQQLARCIANQTEGNILDIPHFSLEILDIEPKDTLRARNSYLRDLESLHKCVIMYLWLSYRFAGVFTSQSVAFHIKSLVEEKIDRCLDKFNGAEPAMKSRMARSKKLAAKQAKLLEPREETLREFLAKGREEGGILGSGEITPGLDAFENANVDDAGEVDIDEDEVDKKAELMLKHEHDAEDSSPSDSGMPVTQEVAAHSH